ncbi:MAG: hypothetical protein RLZZ234_819, partial [Candidatus Parcubacteria bacterium]
SEYSDRPFEEKRDMKGGFKNSPLLLNEGLGTTLYWNEEAIKERAARLAKHAVDVWGAPQVSEEVLTKYRPQKTLKTAYSIEDHQYLLEGSEMYGTLPRDLFDVLRKEIIALDEAVTEEFLKHYVAYKAETNFVDIVPQAQGLLLSINTRGGELIDPEGICKDVSNLRKIANGEFEMKLTSTEDIPYAIGLIRQALELQLGGD